MLRKAVKLGLTVWAIGFFAIVTWTLIWPISPAADAPAADAIICLGGGMDEFGTLHSSSRERATTCAQLILAGKAPVVVFTGGTSNPDGPSSGAQMARVARDLGVPQSAIRIEGLSRSTLQNALFSLPLVDTPPRILVVTEAFHLPRSWVTFHWAGADKVHLFASGRIHKDPDEDSWRVMALLRESLAIWFNIARIGLYTVAGWAGLSLEQRIHWLQ